MPPLPPPPSSTPPTPSDSTAVTPPITAATNTTAKPKRLWKIVVAAVAALILLVVILLMTLDAVARKGIEAGGQFAMGVPTTLRNIHIGLLSGKVQLNDLKIANPQGFDSPAFFSLKECQVEVAPGSLTKDVIEVPYLKISGLTMVMEKNKDGKANYQVILDNLKRFESQDQTAKKEGRKFVIRKLEIVDVNISAETPLLGKVTLPIDKLTLENVGTGGDNGQSMPEIMATLVKTVFIAAINKGGDILPKDFVGDLGKGMQGLGQLGAGAVKIAGQALNEVGKGVEEVGKGVGDALNNVGKGLGDLFSPPPPSSPSSPPSPPSSSSSSKPKK